MGVKEKMNNKIEHTRIELARKGIITNEVKEVAKDERMDPEQLSKDIADGLTVISRNVNHNIKPLGVGKGLRTKVNANIGTSKDRISIEEEMEKLDVLIKYGADAVMDLSTGGPIIEIRRRLMERSTISVGTVPIYQAVAKTAAEKGSRWWGRSKGGRRRRYTHRHKRRKRHLGTNKRKRPRKRTSKKGTARKSRRTHRHRR